MKCHYCGRDVEKLRCIVSVGCACDRPECQEELEKEARSFEEETSKPFYPVDVKDARHLNILMWRLARELREQLIKEVEDPATILHWHDIGLKLTEDVIKYIDEKYPEQYFHIITKKTWFSGGTFELIRPIPKSLLIEALKSLGFLEF